MATIGCGGGGGSSAAVVQNPSTISNLTVTPHSSETIITFNINSPSGHALSLNLQYSEDRGKTFQNATVRSGEITDVKATDDSLTLTWNPQVDLSSLQQADLLIKITPTDQVTKLQGAASTSSVFALGSNTAPIITSITAPASTGGGQISFLYTVLDGESDHVALTLEYSTNNGSSWNSASPGTSGDGTNSVSTTPAGLNHNVSWFGQADAPSIASSQTLFRITPFDTSNGTAGTTSIFSVNFKAPTINQFTVSNIPTSMNGSVPVTINSTSVSFTMKVNNVGTEFIVDYGGAAGGTSPDPTTLSIVADRTLGSVNSGTSLASLFTKGSSRSTWIVDGTHSLPAGYTSFTATIMDYYGNISTPFSFTVSSGTPTASELPFDVADQWLVDFTKDYSTTTFTGGGSVSISVDQVPNGVADYEEDLLILGLNTNSPTSASAALDTNAIILNLCKEETIGRLRILFGGNFAGSNAGYNSNLTFTHNAAGSYNSAIRCGGDDSVPGFTLGRAHYDYRNGVYNDNRAANLGIFGTNMIEFHINNSFSFQVRFNSLIPGRGIPVGEGPNDHIVLAPSFNRVSGTNTAAENARYDEIYISIESWGLSLAVVCAHEIGHSIGLVANGALPTGLFGGAYEASFSGIYTNDFHLDGPGANIMASALSFTTAVSGTYQFLPLIQSYLKHETVLGAN